MISSMTGFGRSKVESDTFQITVEMKSVNHRFLEMSIRLPKQMMVFEDKIRKIIAQQVRRGRIEVSISITGEGLVERKLSVNWSLLKQYQSMMEDIKGKFQLQDSITLGQLMAMPEVTAIEEIENVNEQFENSLYEAVRQAAQMLKTMRDGEGERLHKDMAYHLQEIHNCVNAIIPHAPIVTQKYRERLENRLKELHNQDLDEQRLLTEVAMFAERCDIHEELVRLQSHLEQFRETLQIEEPVGRKMDFIVQEMHREINTIGSKANDLTISKYVVEMKNNLEKIREQVQNIE
ncbi:YicC/YloC family endoribonuclease [Bacillus toyonensis]|uniref:YicC/YloC family endoribonuclease n=1 Tax=Bacillus toyonensis TaxID=155322 RepID=UPI000BEFD075|nr:YicC/YloC family endoribonuclease [Bacillus toyonensis]PEK05482.1 YicC family protein [Bacillus toyonensis]PEL08644.1 YicC family protein [Bacillus toyonensis]PEP07261.1 YicC family protein [Bacillus toyonensis]PEU39876.1 YicC family protein [Bacillus toyonensis]PGC97286.1 YicC family protein [Bacillus toyonensis]